jgi:serine protease
MSVELVKKSIAIIWVLIAPNVAADASSVHNCLLLGPEPSFIIQFYHTAPTFIAREQISSQELSEINFPGITFSNAKRMAHGYYVVHFKLDKQSNAWLETSTAGSNCYTQKSLSKIVEKIKQAPIIATVTPNFLSSIMEVSHENIPVQWNLQMPPGGIDTENTWINFTKGVPNTTIAVLDTGILNHDALNPNILPGVHFTNAGEAGLSATPSCIECAGANHGTMVAGIIASTGKFAYGGTIFGVAPHSTILPINVFTKFTDQKTCGFTPCIYSYLSDQINALEWLAGNTFTHLNAPASTIIGVNMSLGNVSECPKVAELTLKQVQKHNMSVIVAAGNQNNDAAHNYPANCKDVISVAATGYYGERAAYSNWGKSVTIAAPGGNGVYGIFSTINNSYIQNQGTSFAAPHVSGVIAILYAIDPTLNPTKVKDMITSPASVTEFPRSDALPSGSISCINHHLPQQSCGAGIINAYKAAKKTNEALAWE